MGLKRNEFGVDFDVESDDIGIDEDTVEFKGGKIKAKQTTLISGGGFIAATTGAFNCNVWPGINDDDGINDLPVPKCTISQVRVRYSARGTGQDLTNVELSVNGVPHPDLPSSIGGVPETVLIPGSFEITGDEAINITLNGDIDQNGIAAATCTFVLEMVD